MTENPRDGSGRFVSDHDADADDIRDALNPGEPYTTSEIAKEVGIPRRTALKYLVELADEGKINKKTPDERTAIWWVG